MYRQELVDLGKTIRKLRTDKKISQEALAFKSGLHRNYISSLELAQKNPTYTTLIKIANALDIDVSQLISKENCHDLES